MGRYAARRIAQIIPTLVGLVVVVFFSLRIAPGDPAVTAAGDNPTQAVVEAYRAQMGLDQPLHLALVEYLGSVALGDFGESLVRRESVGEIIVNALPITFTMATAAMVIATIVGVAIGTSAAYLSWRGRNLLDNSLTSSAIVTESIPPFVLGLIGLLLFVLTLGWFPATGVVDFGNVPETFRRLALPVGILALGTLATIARVTRTSILEILNEDYIRTARALGESPLSALNRHALRNALLPVITMTGLSFGRLLGGTVVMELIFTLPGMGTSLLSAILARDYPTVQGLVIIYSVLYVGVNLVTDLLYRVVDPRIVLK